MPKPGCGGTPWEREFCRQLSLWWTRGMRDDVFWRIGGSGGRARIRGRKGKHTQGQHGDVAATDPIGKPLIDFVTIELKKGYNKFSIQDLLDKPKRGKEQLYEEWFRKEEESKVHSGSYSWMLVVAKKRREPLVIMPQEFVRVLSRPEWNGDGSRSIEFFRGQERLTLMRLEDFLEQVNPAWIRDIQRGGKG